MTSGICDSSPLSAELDFLEPLRLLYSSGRQYLERAVQDENEEVVEAAATRFCLLRCPPKPYTRYKTGFSETTSRGNFGEM